MESRLKSIGNIHTAWLAAAASAIMIAGAGIASADNATTTPQTTPATQQQTGATAAAAATPAAAPTSQPVKKKKERIRRAERGTKSKAK
jgi:hypothetical protein